MAILSGTFSDSLQSSGVFLLRPKDSVKYSLTAESSKDDFIGKIVFQKSSDGGQTFQAVAVYEGTVAVALASTFAVDIPFQNDEPKDVLVRLSCEEFNDLSSDAVTYSISEVESVLVDAKLEQGEIKTADGVVLMQVKEKSISIPILFSPSIIQTQRISVGFADLIDGSAVLFGEEIPNNAIILRSYLDVTETFKGDGDDSSLIKVGLEDQDNDVVADVAINAAADWDVGLHEGIQDGAIANALKLSAGRRVAVTLTIAVTDTVLTAGAMDLFIEWVQGS